MAASIFSLHHITMAPRGREQRGRKPKEKPEFDQAIIDLSRVTRVTKGGKQLSFRACVVIGDRKGWVGYGMEKGKDVQIAVDKAVHQAKKHLIRIPIVRDTIPHRVEAKYRAGRVMMKPAPRGSGIIAGSAVRVILELAGVQNASAKILSKTNNKVTNVKAAFAALESFKPIKKRIVEEREIPITIQTPTIVGEGIESADLDKHKKSILESIAE